MAQRSSSSWRSRRWPEHRGPEADEQGPALGIVAVVLVDRLGPDPEAEAEGDRAERRRLQVGAAQAGGVEALTSIVLLLDGLSMVCGATVGVDDHEKEKHGSGDGAGQAGRHAVARWPLGMGLAFWRYLWRTMPLHRSDEDRSPDRDLPPSLPGGLADGRLRRLEDGSGPLFRRRYRVRIEGSRTPRS